MARPLLFVLLSGLSNGQPECNIPDNLPFDDRNNLFHQCCFYGFSTSWRNISRLTILIEIIYFEPARIQTVLRSHIQSKWKIDYEIYWLHNDGNKTPLLVQNPVKLHSQCWRNILTIGCAMVDYLFRTRWDRRCHYMLNTPFEQLVDRPVTRSS